MGANARSRREPGRYSQFSAIGRIAVTLGLAAALASAAACSPVTSAGTTNTPHTRTFTAAIESSVPYVAATKKCVAKNAYDKPGPTNFRNLLLATYGTNVGGKTVFTGITRPCDGTVSEHAEGRALDWGMDYRVPAMRTDGKTILRWLFATDSYGHTFAMAKRLGIMYVIWNKQIYGSWNDYKPKPYACGAGTDPTSCHVDHMHFSFSWPGALAQTSFFTGKVVAPAPAAGAGHATR
jgi:hypothetical protein